MEPSKLKSSEPLAVSSELSAFVRLKTSKTGSTVRSPPTAKGRDSLMSHVKNALSRRSVLRSRISPSVQMRSEGWAARSPRRAQLSETGDADR